MPEKDPRRRYTANLQGEVDSAALYRTLAQTEKNPQLAQVYRRLAASGVALFLIGAGTTLFTARSVLFSGVRQLLVGFAAAGVTFGLGKLIGVAVTS